MSWQNSSLIILRTMLNDADCDGTNTYSTQRLEDLLITSAYFLPIDINFKSSYVVDVSAYSITPNPDSQDDGKEFISFMVLRAACLADEGAFRNAALLQGVTARLGPASLQTASYGAQLAILLNEGPCRAFEELKKAYNFGYKGAQTIQAVMSPFASNDFFPSAGEDTERNQD
tara:strand:- start:1375 stop:1893 length:519 start_codon:yes stop_codon:yes gene_type:complete